eukprot:TRINITY_DN85427_c0_g1_i1.p1 TRINITY_DN85427_c0_g1~~TRINITY_DN85427_c0_g1_i1.p1  ORF type:complete len:201 (-),score=33.17 TRINITY_DN85427_c0_g1_i1:8-610(-)
MPELPGFTFSAWLRACCEEPGMHHSETGVVGREIAAAGDSDDKDSDPYDLHRRFIFTHKADFAKALGEIRNGKKRSCWSWYIFPTAPWVVDGVERGSMTNKSYALRDHRPNQLRGDDAARAYLRTEAEGVCLRRNYIEMMTAVAEQLEEGVPPVQLVGSLDDPKLRSSLRLFERISRNGFDAEVNSTCLRALKALEEPLE